MLLDGKGNMERLIKVKIETHGADKTRCATICKFLNIDVIETKIYYSCALDNRVLKTYIQDENKVVFRNELCINSEIGG